MVFSLTDIGSPDDGDSTSAGSLRFPIVSLSPSSLSSNHTICMVQPPRTLLRKKKKKSLFHSPPTPAFRPVVVSDLFGPYLSCSTFRFIP